MEEHDHSTHEPPTAPGFWQSRTGLTLIVFLVIAAILLGYEHRVHVLGSNSGPFLFLAVWIGMHFFMHRGHGGHSGHGSRSDPLASRSKEQDEDSGEKP